MNAIDLESDSATLALRKYVNMPVWLDGELSTQMDESSMTETLTGSAITFPGFVPQLSDLFLYPYTKERVGIFKVSSIPVRTSFKKETTFTFEISMVYDYSSRYGAKLDECTSDIFYFNPKGYGENKSFLTTKQNLLDTRRLNKQMARLDVQYKKFFDYSINSFKLKDRPYDPYLVEFYRTCLSARTDRTFIEIPYRDETTLLWEASVYGRIESEAWFSNPYMYMNLQTFTYRPQSAMTTILNGEGIIQVSDNPDDEVYPFFKYVNLMTPTTDLDLLIYNYVQSRTIDIQTLFTQLKLLQNSTNEEFQFYIIPVLWYIARRAVYDIENGETYRFTTAQEVRGFRIAFTEGDLDTGVLTLPYAVHTVLYLLDPTGKQYAINDIFKTEVDGTTTLDVAGIQTEQAISTLTGEWYVYLTSPIETIYSYEDL